MYSRVHVNPQMRHSTRQCKHLLLGQQQQLLVQQQPAPRSIKTTATAATTSTSSDVVSTAFPMQRKAWHITQQGDMDSLKLQEESMPALLPGQVLVEVKAWGLNFADVFCALGLYKAAPKGDFIPGLEFAGTVVNVLPGDQQQQQQQQQQHSYRPGDRVLGVLRFGAFASHVALPAAYLRPIPQHWTFEQAASYPVQTLTAAYGLFAAGGFKLGQAVLVHSAAGGVGLQALQILSKCDAAVLGLVGSEDKVQMLQEKYGNAVLQHQQAEPQQQQQPGPQQQQDQDKSNGQQQQRPYFEFACRAGDAAGAAQQLSAFLARSGCSGFDVSLDSLGPGPYFQASYDALNPCGKLVIFGAGALTPKPGLKVSLNPLDLLSAPAALWGLVKLGWGWVWRPKLDVLNMPGDNKGVIGFNLIWLYDRLEILAGLYDKVDALGLDVAVVGRVFGFEQLPEALKYLQSGRSVGKVVLSVAPSEAAATRQ